jgi:3-deoxy-7-phosphoheptulonate synthase
MESIEEAMIAETSPLPSPGELKRKYPLDADETAVVLRARRQVADVLHGRDPRLVVIVGPCSLHHPEAALEYAARLAEVAEATKGRLVVVMRTYVEKPRTTVGWKGLVNDPYLDGSCDVAAGLELSRRLLRAIVALGVPCASELLHPTTFRYLGDTLSWAAIGARTSQSQTHREMASALPLPVGFKNGTDGALESAVNAMRSAGEPHTFLSVDERGSTIVMRTRGNSARHVILRGGGGRSNYGPGDVKRTADLLVGERIARPIMVDCSHDNSAKDPARQPIVLREVLRQIQAGERRISGVLIEGNLRPGKQSWRPSAELEYGVSITDACLGWEETKTLLYEAAESAL